MPVKTGGLLLILLLVAVTVVCDGGGEFPARVLTLARAFPANKTVELDILKARDRVRHARILQGFTGGVVDFNVFGTSDPYYGGGLAPDAVRLLNRVQKVVNSNSSSLKVSNFVFSRIGFSIQKGVATQLVGRLPAIAL